jgi:hypothetical protein
MNQYKIGDTVWTRKRGEGTITDHSWCTPPNRPYRIRFKSAYGYHSPKAENLYRTEAAMAWDIACKAGKFDVTMTVNVPDFIKPDQIQPKFKVGDAVYLRGGKWTVSERYWSGTEYRYNVSRPITPDSDNLLAGIQESDLRYWKETVLTHKLAGTHLIQKVGNGDGFFNHALYTKLRYIGKCELNDLFAAENAKWNTIIFLGQRGDDI